MKSEAKLIVSLPPADEATATRAPSSISLDAIVPLSSLLKEEEDGEYIEKLYSRVMVVVVVFVVIVVVAMPAISKMKERRKKEKEEGCEWWLFLLKFAGCFCFF